MVRIAFQGVPGAYSELACYQAFASCNTDKLTTLAYPSFESALTALREGEVDYTALPIENALAGSVLPAYHAIMELGDLPKAQAELSLPVRHCLLTLPDVPFSAIQEVYSHPQALAQCDRIIKEHNWTPQSYFDTAGAAQMIAEQSKPHAAAIASSLAAQTYGLTIQADHIADEAFNQTRFFFFGDNPIDHPALTDNPRKTALIVGLPDRAGALNSLLTTFAQHHINLTKIESHPTRQQAWQYHFFIEFEADGFLASERLTALLQQLEHQSTFFRILGQNFPSLPPTPLTT